VKVLAILTTFVAFALVVPMAQATSSGGNSVRAELRALTIQGDAMNRKYHLGNYAPKTATQGFVSDVASSSAVARYQAGSTANQSDALSRYQTNVNEPTNVTATPSGGGVFHSPAADAGIAAGLLLLISLAGFTVVRSRNQPLRPA